MSQEISIQVWAPSTSEVTIDASLGTDPTIQSASDGGLSVDEKTINGGIVITGRTYNELVLRTQGARISRDEYGILDRMRILQKKSSPEQLNFRYNLAVDSEEITGSRVAIGVSEVWGESTRRKFEAPCLIQFGSGQEQEWWSARGSDSNGLDYFDIDLIIYEIVQG